MTNISPKNWALSKQSKKYDKPRDTRKATPNGHRVKRQCNYFLNNDSLNINKNGLNNIPTPIDNYLNNKNINTTNILSNLSSIISDTNPNSVIITPKGKTDNITKEYNYLNTTRIHIYYKYSNKDKINNEYYKIKENKIFKKNNKLINDCCKLLGDNNIKIKQYIPPIINDMVINLNKVKVMGNGDEKYILCDCGKNIMLTGIGSLFEITKGHKWNKNKDDGRYVKNNIGKVTKIDKYKLYIGVDNILKELNQLSLNIDYKKTKLFKQLKNQQKLFNKYYFKNENNENNNINDNNILEKYKLKWIYIGSYNGNLDEYNINKYYNKYYKTIKKYKIDNILCRWIKIIPLNKNDLKYKQYNNIDKKLPTYNQLNLFYKNLFKFYGKNIDNDGNAIIIENEKKYEKINDKTFDGCRITLNIENKYTGFYRQCDGLTYWGRDYYKAKYDIKKNRDNRYQNKLNAKSLIKNTQIKDLYFYN